MAWGSVSRVVARLRASGLTLSQELADDGVRHLVRRGWGAGPQHHDLTPQAVLAASLCAQGAATTGIADPAGNHLGSDHNWSFTTGGQASSFSLWPETNQPAVAVEQSQGAHAAVGGDLRQLLGQGRALQEAEGGTGVQLDVHGSVRSPQFEVPHC